ncbi:MAG: efflux RND transporter periplasmic adaptor subunit [Thiohalophilus sp.]
MSAVSRTVTRCARSVWWLILLLPAVPALSAEAPRVVVETAQKMDIVRQVPLSGTVNSLKASRLSSEVSGQVSEVRVDVGDRVEAGQELLHLDGEISQWEYRASQALSEQLEAELADARRRYADAQRLRKQNSISENEIRLREAEVRIKAAALERQKAEQQKQQARYARHVIRAPFAGVISQKLTEQGEWVNPGSPVLELVSLERLRADFSVPQTFYPRIDPDSRISLQVEALSSQPMSGHIEAVVPVNDPAARTFLLRAQFDEMHQKLTPGMSVHGVLEVGSGRQGVVISRDAILRYPDGRVTVWVVDENNGKATVSERQIETGHGFDGKLEIRKGLEAGETVVVEGNEALTADQNVRIERRRNGDS